MEVGYKEAKADIYSMKPEELKKNIHEGRIPAVYKGVISEIEVKEVRRKKVDKSEVSEEMKSPYGNPEEMKERAVEGYFVRDPEKNLVYCHEGEILRKKIIKKNENIR